MTIYVVTAGEYSDYHIVGCFTDKALAEKYAALGSEACIEEYAANPHADQLHAGLRYFSVHLAPNGDAPRNGRRICSVEPGSYQACEGHDVTVSRWRYESEQIFETELHSCQWATDKKHALKIANERRAAMLALGLLNDIPGTWHTHTHYDIRNGNFEEAHGR